jgi:hypothetical protein
MADVAPHPGIRARSGTATASAGVAAIEKYSGTYSERRGESFCEWARKMSAIRPKAMTTAINTERNDNLGL